jgi:hypothetical protein
MITRTTDFSPVDFSVTVYRLLLSAYPQAFRQEYGSQMLQVFRDLSIRAYRENGSDGIFRLWALTFLDLIKSVASSSWVGIWMRTIPCSTGRINLGLEAISVGLWWPLS